jgi:hypothetical protein
MKSTRINVTAAENLLAMTDWRNSVVKLSALPLKQCAAPIGKITETDINALRSKNVKTPSIITARSHPTRGWADRRREMGDAFISRMNEEASKPSLFTRVLLRMKYGRDSLCDSCGSRTWWNGNICNANGIEVVICDYCHARLKP